MENSIPLHLNPVILSTGDPKLSRQISELHQQKKIRKIAPRIYTALNDPAGDIIRKNILNILGILYPGAILSHRSAFEYRPTSSGNIFVTHSYTKKVRLPGVNLHFLEGHGPLKGDHAFTGQLYVSQRERAFLENLQVSRKPGPDSKTLTLSEIKQRLEKIIRINGESEINKLRDKARDIAEALAMPDEFSKLDKIISALLSTSTSRILTSPVAQARAFGVPYDEARVAILENLFIELHNREFKLRPDKNVTTTAFRNFAFFESYFSNYIEGTVFAVDEAKQIIETQTPMASRDEDSHDVLGTYQLTASREEMTVLPNSADHLLQILQYRHKILLSARTSKKPGEFKDRNNFAGQTAFVDMTLTRGTLIKGFDYYKILEQPLARAIFMMFMISEVHPFLDGNGRIARIMMNADLTSDSQSKIIIPTVYREDYIGALRKLTRQQQPDAYIRMMERIHAFSETVYDEDMDAMHKYLEQCNAFLEPEKGKLKFIEDDTKASGPV